MPTDILILGIVAMAGTAAAIVAITAVGPARSGRGARGKERRGPDDSPTRRARRPDWPQSATRRRPPRP